MGSKTTEAQFRRYQAEKEAEIEAMRRLFERFSATPRFKPPSNSAVAGKLQEQINKRRMAKLDPDIIAAIEAAEKLAGVFA